MRKLKHALNFLWEKVYYFFPVQLMLVHLKKNLLLLLLWVLLFGFISNQMGIAFGIPNLFLSPEYRESVSFFSFLVLGFSIGGFIMAFHIYTYVTYGPNFQFIATLSRPFFKFCVNNSFIPLIFVLIHSVQIYRYQSFEELSQFDNILLYILGYFLGLFIFIAGAIFYFFATNKDLLKISKKHKRLDETNQKSTIQTIFSKKLNWETLFTKHKEYRVDYYIGAFYKIKKTRDASHYDQFLLRKVFAQNHLNVSIFEIAILITFIILGSFREVPLFMVPAGVSIMLLFTMVVMIYSTIYSWLKGWTLTVLVVFFLAFNFFSVKYEFNQYKNYAYGLNYENKPAEYSKDRLIQIYSDTAQIEKEKALHKEMLNNWHNKIYEKTGEDQPWFIVINTSGGGLRSALWTLEILQKINQRTENQFFENVNFVTGASGGMIGAAYYRALFLSYLEEEGKVQDPNDKKYVNYLGKDLLNHVSFTIATNDLFVRYQNFKDGEQTYPKDRGYAFEWQLNQNTENLMNKRLGAYRKPEFEGEIPYMVYTPTIINDGRRLIISAQPSTFLSSNLMFNDLNVNAANENVDFQSIFKNHSPENIRYTSVLRMNATFPYILPMVSMPTEPRMEVMDAGIRDNYGTKLTWRYLYSMRDWILENTKGVIYIKIRDNKKDFDIENIQNYSIIDRLMRPFGNFYDNFPRTQDYDQDELTLLGKEWLGDKLNSFTFYLKESPQEPIALSWHLTKREKNMITKTANSERIEKELKKLLDLLQFKNE